ncbi:helix-turn-helix domain-containing protein [Alkalihalobacillus deserti]|uniref:helix-turn-helix domain-containing protein n=1 Tax=Alkalihalobacillus deserti TaxID=2879466 RepID=UPI001D14539C|nr:helix-turn-helix transcriptional regulator [Alkalihalobacillus deserti]
MVGELVKKHRMKKGLSLAELAKQAGVDKSFLSSIEGKTHFTPSLQVLEKITPVLGMSIDALLVECSLETSDSVWDNIVIDALEAGMTTEEYIEFIGFVKELSSKTTSPKMPSAYYFEMFSEKSVTGDRFSFN